MKETDGEDVRLITIDALAKVSPKIQDQLDRVVGTVHHHRKSTLSNANPNRATLSFSCRCAFIVMRSGGQQKKKAKFLLDSNLHISKLLSPEDKVATEKLWPRVNKAREERKRAIFRGLFAYIEGKIIDSNEM